MLYIKWCGLVQHCPLLEDLADMKEQLETLLMMVDDRSEELTRKAVEPNDHF